MKKISTIFIAILLLLTGCSKIDKNTETFITEYLTLRFETINMMNGIDDGSLDLIEHIQLVKPYLSEERYEEYTRKRESNIPLRTYDFTVEKGGTFKIENIKIEKKEKDEYSYEVVVIIDNVKEKLKTKYTGTLKIDKEGLIYYDYIDKMKGSTEKLNN